MKSIGEHLRTAREEKGYSFDQVVHDTNISREYIHALEEDNFDFFPAEAYLIGFLRNYSEYLELEPSKMVGIYKNFKISEEPVPMDLLLGKKKAAPEKKETAPDEEKRRGMPRWLIPLIAVLILASVAAFLFLPSYLNREEGEIVQEEVAEAEKEVSAPKEFFLTEDTLDINIVSGDSINVSTGSKLLSFDVSLSAEEQFIAYTDIDGIARKMELVEETEQVVLIGETVGVYFFVKRVSPDSVTLIAQKVSVDEAQTVSAQEEGSDTAVAAAPSSSARISEKIVIMTESYPKAYEIDAFFRGDGLFRYQADAQGRNERFYQAGERLKIDVNRSALLWSSNAGTVDLKIAGKEVGIGESGQVVVRSVKWVKNNETGKYELVIIPYN